MIPPKNEYWRGKISTPFGGVYLWKKEHFENDNMKPKLIGGRFARLSLSGLGIDKWVSSSAGVMASRRWGSEEKQAIEVLAWIAYGVRIWATPDPQTEFDTVMNCLNKVDGKFLKEFEARIVAAGQFLIECHCNRDFTESDWFFRIMDERDAGRQWANRVVERYKIHEQGLTASKL